MKRRDFITLLALPGGSLRCNKSSVIESAADTFARGEFVSPRSGSPAISTPDDGLQNQPD